MPSLSRRSLLAGAAASGAVVALPGRARARGRIPVVRERRRAVVIGSGFGGGVAALRLAQAGVDVLVLERGRRWPTGPNAETFPHALRPDKRVLFYGSAPRMFDQPLVVARYAGLLDAVVGEHMSVITAAGVGGGSLVYQGMTLQPSESVFEAHLPSGLDYRTMSARHYPRVAAMLGIETAPDALIASPTYEPSRVFARNAARAGFGVEKIPMPIDWTWALRELRGEMKPSYTNGDCALGVNNGGKHSVDVTYIRAAEKTRRVEVAPLHNVTEVRRLRSGEWRVTAARTDDTGRVLAQRIITTPALVMAAGSMGTSRMLVRAGALGHIPDLPDGLGEGWGSNGDRIYAWTSEAEDYGRAQGGPVVYGSKEWDDPARANTVIQASLPPTPNLDLRSTMLVGFGVSEARGRFAYDAHKDKVPLQWAPEADAVLHQRIRERVEAVTGGDGTLLDTNKAFPSTWHPLGGACMGTVCDLDGRVQGQRGLYVLDGALIPGTTAACNPSMTIAAVAERAMERLVKEDVGRVI